MIITKLELDNNDNFSPINFSKQVTIICGDTDKGKTLIYAMIEYVIACSIDSVDEGAFHKKFPNANRIICFATNNDNYYRFERYVGKEIVDVFINDNLFKQFNNLTEYGDFIFSLFNFNPNIKLLTNKKMATSTLTFREYTKFLFFNESRITESKSFVDILGPMSFTKYQNLFCYLLTGISPNSEKITEKDNKEKIKAVSKPLLEYMSKIVELKYNDQNELIIERTICQEKINSLTEEINLIIVKIKELDEKIKISKTELNKLISLSNYYKESLNNNFLAIELFQYLKNYKLFCHQCHSEYTIPDINEITFDFDYNEIENSICSKKTEQKQNQEQLQQYEVLKIDKENELDNEKVKLSTLQEKIITKSSVHELFTTIQQDIKSDKIVLDKLSDNELFNEKINYICDNIYNDLTKMKLISEDEKVTFDYSHKVFDFLIGNVRRTIKGKGLRTVVTCLFIYYMTKIVSENLGYLGFTLIDSLWTTLKYEDKDFEDKVINYLLTLLLGSNFQYILFDNDYPSIKDNNVKIFKISEIIH